MDISADNFVPHGLELIAAEHLQDLYKTYGRNAIS